MLHKIFGTWLLIYLMRTGNTPWVISCLLIDYPLITHWLPIIIDHRLVMSGIDNYVKTIKFFAWHACNKMVALESSIIVDTHWTYQKQSAMYEWTGTESFSIIAKVPFQNLLWEEGWQFVLLALYSWGLLLSSW